MKLLLGTLLMVTAMIGFAVLLVAFVVGLLLEIRDGQDEIEAREIGEAGDDRRGRVRG